MTTKLSAKTLDHGLGEVEKLLSLISLVQIKFLKNSPSDDFRTIRLPYFNKFEPIREYEKLSKMTHPKELDMKSHT
jgi:hypothetical protein